MRKYCPNCDKYEDQESLSSWDIQLRMLTDDGYEEINFCPVCGSELVELTEEEWEEFKEVRKPRKNCSQCGFESFSSGKFCPKCGKKFAQEIGSGRGEVKACASCHLSDPDFDFGTLWWVHMDDDFCRECGQEFRKIEYPLTICSCGKRLGVFDKHCSQCGNENPNPRTHKEVREILLTGGE